MNFYETKVMNSMHKNDDVGMVENELSLSDFLGFLSENWKLLLGVSAAGVLSAAGYLAVTPPQYEATAIMAMAQVGDVANTIANADANLVTNVETPSLLSIRLGDPATYTREVIKNCDVANAESPQEEMPRLVKTSVPANLASALVITVRRNTRDLAKQCLQQVFEMVRAQQNDLSKPFHEEIQASLARMQDQLAQDQKSMAGMKNGVQDMGMYLGIRDESIFLISQIEKLQRLAGRDVKTRLISPVYVSYEPVFPKKTFTLILGLIIGLAFALLIALGKKAAKSRSIIPSPYSRRPRESKSPE